MTIDPLETLLSDLALVKKRTGQLLGKLGLYTIRDFLFFYPRSYEDRRTLPSIMQLREDQVLGCVGVLTDINSQKVGNKTILKATLNDSSGKISCVWFNQAFLKKTLQDGCQVYLKGKCERNSYTQRLQLVVQETERIDGPIAGHPDFQRLLPVYPLVAGLYQKQMRSLAAFIFKTYHHYCYDFFTGDVRDRYQMMALHDAIYQMHFPQSPQAFQIARKRLVFNECFFIQFPYLLHKSRSSSNVRTEPWTIQGNLLRDYMDSLPYELTNAQKKTFQDICEDLSSGRVLNRLIQGDVGSGKTDIGILAMLLAVQQGMKAAFMAPTEVLAQQHALKLNERLAPFGVRVYLLKGKLTKKEKEGVLKACKDPNLPLIVVGTHALIQDSVDIVNLGIQIIDEQHRFGVMQRLHLHKHREQVHSLYLTATPIPRSLMLSCYGDLDKSIMGELPGGRQPIKTHFVKFNKLDLVWSFCKSEVAEGRQVFVIYPLVEDSEKTDLRSAMTGFEDLRSKYNDMSIGLIHGRMKSQEKQEIMADFKAKKAMILVSTTVIEVGIDVPNASTIVIMHAERFGLSQLHQLRGRVGRGNLQSTCFLVTNAKSDDTKKRINAMLETTDGFKLAELDLKLRGPGDMLGTRQSGDAVFDLTDLVKDEPVLLEARSLAVSIVKEDPNLTMEKHVNIKGQLGRHAAPLVGGQRLN